MAEEKREVKKQVKRSEIDPQFKWRLEDLYASDEDWTACYENIRSRMEEFAQYRGALAKKLKACLALNEELAEKTLRLYAYATMRLHEDGANAFYQGLADKAENLYVRFSEAVSFITPEILTLSEETISEFLKENPIYKQYIADILRVKEHVLTPEVEGLLASAQEIAEGPSNIFAMLANADMKFGTVRDENGDEVELTHGRYGLLLESGNREVRKAAFETLYDAFIRQKNTIAANYGTSVKADLFFARARKYASAMEASLSANNIPVAVYENLVKTVDKNLHLMHRFVKIRKERFGLADIHFYDLYTPLVPELNVKVGFEEAKETVYKALEPLGDEYRKLLQNAFDSSWIDVYENEGKRSGAYSNSVYGAHPYVLLNYSNRLNDMFTLAHEMGHALHSYLTQGNQPFIYGDYTIFLAEIASTLNEALLINYLLNNTTDKNVRVYLLDYYLHQFRTTLFRQTMFAEFEASAHQMAEAGEPLTADSMKEVYTKLLEKNFGPDMVLDEQIKMEWLRIPHFYNAFYVYQYATGFSSAIALSHKILTEGKPAADRYIKNMLCAGSSDYSIEILKNAGVDMSTPEPIEGAMKVFEELLDELESLKD